LTGATGPDGWAVYDPATESVHFLNESARAIWELCDGATTIEEMASAVSELTGLTPEDAHRDVSVAVERLRALGLVSG
jgi:PqqD family protein of HPr-rel-A system